MTKPRNGALVESQYVLVDEAVICEFTLPPAPITYFPARVALCLRGNAKLRLCRAALTLKQVSNFFSARLKRIVWSMPQPSGLGGQRDLLRQGN